MVAEAVVAVVEEALPQNLRPNLYATNAHPSSEPVEGGRVSYAPDWMGVGGDKVEPPREPLQDQVDDDPTRLCAVECMGRTNKQAKCRNMTRDRTGYCWRHRHQA